MLKKMWSVVKKIYQSIFNQKMHSGNTIFLSPVLFSFYSLYIMLHVITTSKPFNFKRTNLKLIMCLCMGTQI